MNRVKTYGSISVSKAEIVGGLYSRGEVQTRPIFKNM